MATATMETLRPPPTLPPLKGIYSGKYRDRNPDIRAAGVTSELGEENAASAVKEIERPESPEPTKKFHRTFRPGAGERTIFYGRAYDPQLKRAEAMTHGLTYPKGEGASGLLNPQPLTLFQQRFLDRIEATNVNNKKRPLGRVPNGKELGLLPKELDTENTTFGVTVEKFGSAGELLNPDVTRAAIDAAEEEDRRHYLVSHKALLAGEQANRGHELDGNAAALRLRRWGKATPHDNAGGGTRKCMHWLADQVAVKHDGLVAKRLDDFRERTQFQLGKPLDPIKDTMKVPPDHTFGILHKPDDCGVGDLLHGRAPKHFLRGEDRRRALVAALRTQLKTMNFEKFSDARAAFEFYDRDGCGRLAPQDIRRACNQLQVPLDDSLLEQLIDFCDVDGDGRIDYKEFVNFLNWRELSVRSQSGFGRLETDTAKLEKQIDDSVTQHSTTNGMYNATLDKYRPGSYRTYGCPTIRTDLPVPAVRSVSDRRTYGNEGDAASCLNPSIFTQHGVWEYDLMLPRGKEEMMSLFANSGIDLDPSVTQQVFDRLGKSEVGIDEFRATWSAVASGLLQQQQQ